MEQAHLVAPVTGVAGWAETVQGLDLMGIVFAPAVVRRCLIKGGYPAIAWTVPNVAQR